MRSLWRPRRTGLALIGLLLAAGCMMRPDPSLHVAAASSLAPPFDELSEVWAGEAIVLSYGASVDLAQQIRNGAPYDVFASADPALIEELASEGLLERTEHRVFAFGELGLVVVEDLRLDLPRGLALLSDPTLAVIAIADPEHAPFGSAARQALQTAGLWEPLERKIVFGGSARHALELVQTGNAQAGLIPVSLLSGNALPWIRVPLDLYQRPAYAIGVLASSDKPDQALRFLESLRGEVALEILTSHGLSPAP